MAVRVRVAVRVRPLNHNEEGPPLVTCPDSATIEVQCPSAGCVRQLKSYSFDMCAHDRVGQSELFQQCGASSLMDSAYEGMKVTILAYVRRKVHDARTP